MKRYNDMFSRLQTRGEGAFIPFVMLGDPQPDLSLQIIDALIEGGADALELGIPFSDPLADGPTIQNAALRAFAANVTLRAALTCWPPFAPGIRRCPSVC